MELEQFSEKDQEAIKRGLSTAELNDKDAAEKLLALVLQE